MFHAICETIVGYFIYAIEALWQLRFWRFSYPILCIFEIQAAINRAQRRVKDWKSAQWPDYIVSRAVCVCDIAKCFDAPDILGRTHELLHCACGGSQTIVFISFRAHNTSGAKLCRYNRHFAAVYGFEMRWYAADLVRRQGCISKVNCESTMQRCDIEKQRMLDFRALFIVEIFL